ncbi:MAG: POTRA domain-containing protein [Bacteroidota bacterium]
MSKAPQIRLLLLTLFLLLIGGEIVGQSTPTIRSIHFEGLRKTRPEYLSSFLKTKIGQPIDSVLLAEDRQTLLNLEPIADVKIRVDSARENTAILMFDITEALTLFPIVNFGGVRGNFWYQLGFTDANWAGKGIKITTFYQNNDGRDNFSFHYRNAHLNGSLWGGSFSAVRWASIEPLFFQEGTVFYDYTNTSIGGTIIKHFRNRQYLETGLTYFVESYNKNSRHIGTVTPGPEQERLPKFLHKFVHRFDRINYLGLYRTGYDNLLNFQTVFNLEDQSLFYILLNETRYFHRLGRRGNLAARLRIGLSTNNDSPFAPFVLDSYINIRGSGNRIDRGTAALILNLEYRHTLFDWQKI